MSSAPDPKTFPKSVSAKPVKSFFVTMLTRDIHLEDAIMDLLDNCVDGILRTESKEVLQKEKPYTGHWAKIKFDGDSFEISDNCGGIPWSVHDYAFRMGRSDDRPLDAKGTVGVYGIGMKRAIFKMGSQCLLSTQNGEHAYEVEIKPEWIADEEGWEIPVRLAEKTMPEDGTVIVIDQLNEGIERRFKDNAEEFESLLRDKISTHYAFIIDKGFEIQINGKAVSPKPTEFVADLERNWKEAAIRPYMFKTTTDDGVEVFMTIGFTRPIPSPDEIDDEQISPQYSSLAAGWTVLCNDRAVLYCDRTEMTGWGEAGVPRYHTQFIAISGIVEFRSKDPGKLPTTTTKRGIDASSPLYLQIKNKMREGLKLFTSYTNNWKGFSEESKQQIASGKKYSFEELKAEASKPEHIPFNPLRGVVKGEQYSPVLPSPPKPEPTTRRISFEKPIGEVRLVADYLFDDENYEPKLVGEACFERALKAAKK